MRSFLSSRAAALFIVAFHAVSTQAQELRGIWVDAFGPGFYTKEQVQQLARHCRDYNFNAVFVQVRKRGDAFYFPQPPNLDPRSTSISGDFDPLAELVRECHGQEPKIQVHAWVVAYFVWAWHRPPPEPDHIFNRAPELLTRDSLGQRLVGEGYYLDPGHPQTGVELLKVATDITSRYDIDGLHWDYLRYPAQDSGYNPTALKRYKEELGVRENPLPNDRQFSEWRKRQVTDFLRWSTVELLAIKPEVVVSAAVFSNYKDSSDYRFADWAAWNKEGILDVAIPMDFSPDNPFVFNPRADFAVTNQWNRTVWIGQGAYMNTIENTITQLHYCRDKGSAGTVLYSYRNPALESSIPLSAGVKEGVPIAKRGEVIMDNREAKIAGEWQSGRFGIFHGEDYHFKGKGTGESHVGFAPALAVDGNYDIYEWHVAGANRAEDAPFVVVHAEGNETIQVNQQINGARWNFLGRFRFESGKPAEVRVTDQIAGADQVVIADAVKFVPVTDAEALPIIEEADVEMAGMKRRQAIAFGHIKEHFQPNWTPPPPLPWKTNPTTGIVKGRISSKATGEPMYNAVVTLGTNPVRQQRTDALGNFAFFDVASEELELNAGTESRRITVRAGQILSVGLDL